ncbi:hypothetical protein ACQJBY_016076 [Aegilops geniculata]
MKVVPGFLLYRGLHELGQYALSGNSMGASRKEGIPTVSCGILSQFVICHRKVYYLTMQDTRCHDDLISLTTSSPPMPISSALVVVGSWTTSSRVLLRWPTCEGQIIFQ